MDVTSVLNGDCGFYLVVIGRVCVVGLVVIYASLRVLRVHHPFPFSQRTRLGRGQAKVAAASHRPCRSIHFSK